MSKKILRILLTMTLCLFLFPVFVHAEENPTPITTLYVNGVDVLENPHTGDWRFDASTGTLTLYDIEITTGYEAEDSPGTYAGIYAEGDLNIVSGGEGTDIISLSQPEVKSAYGILVSGDLNITETQLCIRNNLIPNESYGIVALGNITISDAVIEYQCYFNSLSSVGIFGFSQLDIQNSKLIDIRAPYTESGFGLLSYGGITLNNNDEVYISGMQAGIFSALELNITDTYVDASAESIGVLASGIILDHNGFTPEHNSSIEIKGTELHAYGNDSAIVVYENGNYNDDGTFVPDGTFLQIKEPLLIWRPEGNELVTLTDEYGDKFQLIVDSEGNPATDVSIIPMISNICFNGLSSEYSFKYFPVPYGYTINDMYADYDFTPYTKEGHTFYGWYTDEAGTYGSEFDFDQPLTGDYNLYPKWVKTGTCPGLADCPSIAFTDLNRNLWYHETIDYVVEQKLMQGVSSTQFAPDAATTRAMLVTILWRLEGSPKVDYDMTFADLEAGSWYVEAVRWAASEGIVRGYSDLEFGPNDYLERQQIATILFRHATSKGYDVSCSVSAIDGFQDAASISDYAKEAMAWGSEKGLIKGYTDMTVQPTKNTTRAEIATFLYRFIKLQAE